MALTNFATNIGVGCFLITGSITLIAVGCILLYRIFCRYFCAKTSLRTPIPKLPRRDFTLQELQSYNGDGTHGRILLAVNGKVFDVTNNGQDFYGKGAPYCALAGRDASRFLACFDMNECSLKNTYDDLSDLTDIQMSRLAEWECQFLDRYDYVGRLLKPGEPHRVYDVMIEADQQTSPYLPKEKKNS